MDGDGQMIAEALDELIDPLVNGDADYTKGNRFFDLDALKAMPGIRLIGNSILSFMTKLVSGYWSIFDPTNGYTAVHTAALSRINLDRLQKRYFFETSTLVELNIICAVVRDIEIPARYSGETSSMSIAMVTIEFPVLMMRALLRRFFWRYLVRDFNALSLCVLMSIPSILFGTVFGSYHWWKSIATGIEATAGTTFLAALVSSEN